MEQTITTCDYGHDTDKAIRLDIGGNAGVFLCEMHWQREMDWRKLRNEELLHNKFDILPFPKS